MPRVFSVVVAVLVVAAACGGGDQDRSRVEPPSAAVEPRSDAGVEPPSGATTLEGTTVDSAAVGGATAEVLDQRGRVHLGGRFAWCTTAQSAWDRNDEGFQATLAAVADYNDALGALSGAVDELDRAEALEQIGALRGRALDLIDAYGGFRSHDDTRLRLIQGLRSQIYVLNTGTEGTEGVAHARAREAFDAAASREVSALLREFSVIERTDYRDDNAAALRGLLLPPVVRASLGEAPELVVLAYDRTLGDAQDAVRSGLKESQYEDSVVQAAGGVTHAEVLGDLGDIDLVSAARAYAEAVADYPETIRLAFEAAMAASEAAAAAAAGEGADQVRRESRSAALDAARRVFDDAVAAIEPARWAYWRAENAAVAEAVSAGRYDLQDQAGEARRAVWEEAGYAVSDAYSTISGEATRAAEAARDAAVEANEASVYNAAHRTVAETARVARAEGLASAVVAETLLNEFEMGLIEVDRVNSLFGGESSFGQFLVRAVAVESLVHSDAWHAMQRSLADACG